MLKGPWIIMGQGLCVQQWKPSFRASQASRSKAAVWARFPDMPIQYDYEPILLAIGTVIGKVLKVYYI